MKIFIFQSLSIVLITGLFHQGYGQVDSTKFGKVNIIQDDRISNLMLKHVELNGQNKTIPGYRIQIHFSNEREKAKEVKTKFLTKYPDMGAYESYEQPNFRIRVGDFRTKLEAQAQLKELIQNGFSSAFVVTDEIQLPKLD